MFKVGDYAVCPGHGVGQVCEIEERDLGENQILFYKIRILSNCMTVMIPTTSSDGVRRLADGEEVENVYRVLEDHDVEVDNSTWNRRYRDYMAKVKTGSLIEIAEVLRSLFLLQKQKKKNLSDGERKMLDMCKDLLAQEISITDKAESGVIKKKIESYFEVPSEAEV